MYTKWYEVKVGDVVKINDNEYFPADLVLISSGFVYLINLYFLSNL